MNTDALELAAKLLVLAQRQAGAFPVPPPDGAVWVLVKRMGAEATCLCLPFAELPEGLGHTREDLRCAAAAALPPLLPVVVVQETPSDPAISMGACASPLYLPSSPQEERMDELLRVAKRHGHFQRPLPEGEAWVVVARGAAQGAGYRVSIEHQPREKVPDFFETVISDLEEIPPQELPILTAISLEGGRTELGVFSGIRLTDWNEHQRASA